jgi:hypothetical protein
VQCYSGSGNLWDAHSDMEGKSPKYCGQTDQPIAGLLNDLVLAVADSTLVAGAANSVARRSMRKATAAIITPGVLVRGWRAVA